GRSDARAYEALAEVWLQVSELDRRQGRSRKSALEKALAAVDGALQVAPSRAAAWEKKAFVLRNWYRVMNFQAGGLDPKPILAQVLATAARAVELDPGDVQALDTLGYGHFLRGLQEAREGKDPSPSWTEATVHLGRALERQARYPWGLNDLALVHRWRGNWQREHGQDPGPAWDEAERYFRLAVETDPKYLFAQSNLAELYNARAAHAVSRGVDPAPEALKALEAGARALAIDGRFHSALNHQALAELLRAEFRVDTDADPRPAVERAFGHLQRALTFNATFTRTHYHRALGQLLLARHALRRGAAPAVPLQAGREALAEALRGDPRCADCRVLGARLDLTEAAWARKAGRTALPLLQRAREEARRAVEAYAYDESHQALAWACWRLAEALPPREASAALAEGLAQVEHALRLNPGLGRAHAIQGGLLLARAVALPGEAEHQEAIRQARAALARALELHPLLRWEDEAGLRLQLDGTGGELSFEAPAGR
ncbi:MAG TPA: serine/threonine protein kinase, partial [Myxococcus sp.]|nr:serine/threonine protein kinase [Myxococcus sp.]